MDLVFYDMDGKVVNVGDYCAPIEGRTVKIIERSTEPEYSEEVLIGQQVLDPDMLTILTRENLAFQFRRVPKP